MMTERMTDAISPAGLGAATPTTAPSTMGGSSAMRLKVSALEKRYGGVQALRHVGFDLARGEIMALLGENGAGKSTFVKILAGLVHPDEGIVEIDGRPVSLHPSQRSQASGIAVVHQELGSVRTLSVAENLFMGDAHAGWRWSARRARAAARPLLRRVGLEHLDPGQPVASLNVAEAQLLEIARALIRDAKIVIFDEPTAALSDAEIVRVLAIIRELAAEGRSVIYVTHRLDEVFQIADRITVFRNGSSCPAVKVSDVDMSTVVSMMLGRDVEMDHQERTGAGSETRLSVAQLHGAGLSSPVDLTVRRGEILGLTGQLGSGAIAVVQLLAGVRPAVSGQVALDSQVLSLKSRRAGIRQGVVYCSGERKIDGIFAEHTLLENLSVPWLSRVSRAGWLDRHAERRIATHAAERFALDTGRLGHPVGLLSGGNQQKAVLAKWVGARPAVLLVEEPTRGVDVGARTEIYARIRELCDDGMSVVVASSDITEVLALCDTVAAFCHGRFQAIRPTKQWTEKDLLLHVMQSEVVP